MPAVQPDAILRSLKSGKRGGVFFLFGDEEYLKEEMANAIVAAHLDPSTRDFNFDQMRGGELLPETLASIAATPPMMADWRVVLVRDTQALVASARSRAVIESLIGQTIPGLVLILLATMDKSKAQIYDRLRRQTTAAEFPSLPASDVPGWLVARAQTDGYRLDVEAARALASAIGSELGILIQELRKLYDYVQQRRDITIDDVRAAVGGIARQNRWEWFDMLGDRRFPEARASLPVLLDGGETGVGIVIGIGTHFLRLAIFAHGGERALDAVLPPYQRFLASRLSRQARKWRAQELDAALDDLLRADRLLKSTNLGELAILEELILRLQSRANAN